MPLLIYTLGLLALNVGLIVFAYLDRVYRELGRVTTGHLHANLDIFEAEIEPRLRMERRAAGVTFSLLAQLWLVFVAVETALGVSFFVPRTWEAALETIFILVAEVVLAMHLVPYILVTRTSGRWIVPFIPVVRLCAWLVWPLRAALGAVASLAHLTSDVEPGSAQAQQEGIEALVEAAKEEGILERDEAHLIEQVVEFGDKRVREVMTPRPDIVAIPSSATIEQLRRLLVETKFSRIPVYEGTLDEVLGIAYARDILQISEREGVGRTVREIVRPALFVPETKLGSQLLKEMQLKNHHMAIIVDEYGSVAGLITVEDLVEEIVGEIGEEDKQPAPDVVREADGSLVLRGSVAVERLCDLLGLDLDLATRDLGATTVAGLLNHVAGHVPVPGEVIEHGAVRFEVLEANQRKVLRLRTRRLAAPSGSPASASTS